jgi:hypothetical protein
MSKDLSSKCFLKLEPKCSPTPAFPSGSGVHLNNGKGSDSNALSGPGDYQKKTIPCLGVPLNFISKSTALVPTGCWMTIRKGFRNRQSLDTPTEPGVKREKTKGRKHEKIWC